MLKSRKAELIAELTESFTDKAAVIVCDYKGLTVTQLETLRKSARAKDVRVQVIKNSLATIALGNAKMTGLELKNTNIFVWSEDVVAAAKVAADFASDKANEEKFVIKAGYLDGEAADVAKIEAFAKLPGREELLGMLAATWMAPITNLAIGLDALRQKKEAEA
ncbi:MAG: 50S ribosomal protein L10 [Sulfurimonadaceae bacterium]